MVYGNISIGYVGSEEFIENSNRDKIEIWVGSKGDVWSAFCDIDGGEYSKEVDVKRDKKIERMSKDGRISGQ